MRRVNGNRGLKKKEGAGQLPRQKNTAPPCLAVSTQRFFFACLFHSACHNLTSLTLIENVCIKMSASTAAA